MTLRAPFPWFGGKSRAAHLVWAGFGDVANYVEPFAGSLAVLLRRPTPPRIETVNDLDCYVANFWRALKLAPELVAEHADWPVNEADLHARHKWLVKQDEFRKQMRADPDFFDAKVAGWWVWGICQWIGGGWCTTPEWKGRGGGARRSRGVAAAMARPPAPALRERDPREHRQAGGGHPPEKRPMLSASHGAGNGVHRRARNLSPSASWEKRPVLGRGGRGVNGQPPSEQLPMISGDSGAAGRGVHASGLAEKLPKQEQDRGTDSRLQSDAVYSWMHTLAARLRRVRVCCGDWKRVLGRSSTESIGVTGVLLDPPYSAEAGRDPSLYAQESLTVSHEVREWALSKGGNPKYRIALCGYEGEHDMPRSWECVEWKANGGYAASAGNHDNSKRERIWFSPHCNLVEKQLGLFDEKPRRKRRSA